MTNIEKEINQILNNNPQGLKAREIARLLGMTKSEINKVLYNDKSFKMDSNYIWKNASAINNVCVDEVLQKLNNYTTAKCVTEVEFNKLANWKYGLNHSGNAKIELLYVTQKGNMIPCDSKAEYAMLSYLEENDLIINCGGQNFELDYCSEFKSGRKYYPDIVALTKDHKVIFIEVKPLTAMSAHLNIEKYNALSYFCEENGYAYMMVDPNNNFATYDELYDMDVCQGLYTIFEQLEKETKKLSENQYICFDKTDVNKWYELFGTGYTKKEFELMVHSLIIYFGWHNKFKNGFKVFTRPVRVDNENNIIR